ncbi:MAG: threonine synthase [Icmadophila ericetorum]|nr:threonine synthase [Icmadophila ericetorum]
MAGQKIKGWLDDLKVRGGFYVGKESLEAAKLEFESECVSDEATLTTIRSVYPDYLPRYVAVGSEEFPEGQRIALATANAAKFSAVVDLALKGEKGYSFSEVLPEEFVGLEEKESRVIRVTKDAGWEGVRPIIKAEVQVELGS